MTRTCPHCLSEFSGRPNKRYCCQRCRNTASKRRTNQPGYPRKRTLAETDAETVKRIESLIESRLPSMPQEKHLKNAGDLNNRPYDAMPRTRFVSFTKRWRGQFIF